MRIIQLVILLLSTLIGLAQVPQGIKYQAIARSNQGQVVTNQIVSLEIAILRGSPVGQVQYVETHRPTTNEFGLFTIVIGEGTASQGSFSDIDWSLGEYFLRSSMDMNGGNNYAFMGTSQLLSVPYALYAERTGKSDNDFDQDSTNELQTLNLTGTTLSISNGNSVQLGGTVDLDGDPTNEIQQLSLNGTQLNLSNGGGTISLPADNDGDPSNELQQLSLNGNLLELSNNGGSIQLPPDGDSDSTNEIQTISSSVNGTERTISLSQSNATVVDVADNDNDAGNELQDLTSTKVGNVVSIEISNGLGTSINLDDLDADPSNELQVLSLNGDSLSLSNGGGTVIISQSTYNECILTTDTNFVPGYNYLGTEINEASKLVMNKSIIPIASITSFTPIVGIAGDNILVLNGNNPNSYRYSPSNGNWSSNIPTPQLSRASVTSMQRTTYIFGVNGTSTIQKYDTLSNSWVNAGSLPSVMLDNCSCSDGQNAFIAGGRSSNNAALTVFYKYISVTQSFIVLPTMPFNVYNGSCFILENILYIIGGTRISGSTHTPNNNILRYDIINNTWLQTVFPFPTSNTTGGSNNWNIAPVINHNIAYFFNMSSSNIYNNSNTYSHYLSNNIYLFDSKNEVFLATNIMPLRNGGRFSTIELNNIIYFFPSIDTNNKYFYKVISPNKVHLHCK